MLSKANSFFDDTKSSTLKSSLGSREDFSSFPKQKFRSVSFSEKTIKHINEESKECFKLYKEKSKSFDVIYKKKEIILERQKKPRLNYILKTNLILRRDKEEKTFQALHRTNSLISYFSPYSNHKICKPKGSYSTIPEQDQLGEGEKIKDKEQFPAPNITNKSLINSDFAINEDTTFPAFFLSKSYSKGSNASDYHQNNNQLTSLNMNVNFNMNLNFNMNINKTKADSINYFQNSIEKTNGNSMSEPNNKEMISFINSCTIDQGYCRFLQSKIVNNPQFANNIFFPAIKTNIIEMILNQFGNYLIQNTIEILTISNLKDFLTLISHDFLQIAYSPHGTRVLQKYVEYISTNNELLSNFNLLLNGNIPSFANDENANHIIQKYVSVVKYPSNSFIYESISYNLYDIAITKHGCCVVQKCIMFGTKNQKELLVLLIIKNTYHLITNQFGNYVYQFIIQMNNPVYNKQIIQMIVPNVIILCKHKYASNALEKCLQLKNAEMPLIIMYELTKNEEVFIDLLLDNYGNYVIQTALNTKNQFYVKALTLIAQNYERIIHVPFGFKLMKKIISLYQEFGVIMNQIKKLNISQNNAYKSNLSYYNEYN